MADDPRQKLVPAVQSGTSILRHLSANGTPLGATQIARDCGLNVSSAFNILRTLSHEGLVSFDPQAKTYRLGLGLLDLAAPLLTASPVPSSPSSPPRRNRLTSRKRHKTHHTPRGFNHADSADSQVRQGNQHRRCKRHDRYGDRR